MNKSNQQFVGGPLDGQRYCNRWLITTKKPYLFQSKLGQWAVYVIKEKNDRQAYYIGTADNKRNAKRLVEIWKENRT